jgi:hypothetical protein
MVDFAPHISAMLKEAALSLAKDHGRATMQDAALTSAFLSARKAYHENRGGDALKALGAFWNIYLGFLSEEPEYAAIAEKILAQRNSA